MPKRRRNPHALHHHRRDALILIGSVVAAVMLARSGVLDAALTATESRQFIGSFLAGMLFTSIFTTAPATIMLGKIAIANSLTEVVLVGALGALVSDLIIWRFVRAALAEDIVLIVRSSRRRLPELLRLGLFRWLLPLLGVLVIASPLPDELGLSLLGVSALPPRLLVPLAYIFNAAGILIIGLIARRVV